MAACSMSALSHTHAAPLSPSPPLSVYPLSFCLLSHSTSRAMSPCEKSWRWDRTSRIWVSDKRHV